MWNLRNKKEQIESRLVNVEDCLVTARGEGSVDERWWWARKMRVSAVGRPRQRFELPGREALSGRVQKGPKSRVE